MDEAQARAEREATLFSPERARELLAQAWRPLEDTRKRSPFYDARKRQWKATVVAASTCLGIHGHEADALAVAEALARIAKYEGYTTSSVADTRAALAHLLAQLPPGAAARGALAAHVSAHVRRAVAVSLEGASDASAMALLRLLASDHDGSVRAAAHAAAPKGTLPPWLGVFDSDPTEAAVAWARSQVEPAAAARAEKRARALVDEICATFVKPPREVAEVEKKLAARCSTLPDALVVELARHVGSLDPRNKMSPLLARALSLEGAASLMRDLATRWHREGRRRLDDIFGKHYVGPKRSEARRALGRLLADEAMSHDREPEERTALVTIAAELLGSTDPEWLAQWFATHADSLPSRAVYGVGYPLYRDRRPPPSLTRWALDQVEAGSVFARSDLYTVATHVLEMRPATERRALAARYVTADAPDVAGSKEPDEDDEDEDEDEAPPDVRRAWALRELLDETRDEAATSSLRDLGEQLFAVPKNRACLLASSTLVLYVLPVAREAMRRGELVFSQARLVACAVRSVAKGLADDAVVRFDDARRAKLAPVLSRPEDHRDLDDEEREVYFALRQTHRFEGAGLALEDLDVVGRESAEGNALLDAIVQAARAGCKRGTYLLRRELEEFASRELITKASAAFPDDNAGRGVGVAYWIEDAQDKLDGIERPIWQSRELSPGMVGGREDHLLSLTEVGSLAGRALTELDEAHGATAVLTAHRRAVMALAAASCVLHGDTTALRRAAEALELELVDSDTYRSTADSLTELVALSPAGSKTVKRLAGSDDVFVRGLVARGLRASEPASRALLLKLAADGDRDVRNAAKARLGEGAVPWWTGIFSRDPSETLSDDDATALAPTFETIARVLGPDRATGADALTADEVTALSLALPAALACDIARQQGRGGAHSDSVTHWAMAAAGREGGDEVLVEIVVRAAASPNLDCYPILDAARALAPESLSRFALRLFRAGAAASEDTGPLLMQFAVSLLRPHDAAPLASELLDLFATDEDAFETACGAVAYWLHNEETPPALISWALTHILRLDDETRGSSFELAKTALEKAPAADVRRVAIAALESPSIAIKRWGLTQMLGAFHDRSLDGPRPARVRAFYGDPEYRQAILGDEELLLRALPLARADLRRGRLSFPEARDVVVAVVGEPRRTAKRAAREAANARGANKRGGPRAGSGPRDLTAAERAAYLALRETVRFEGETWHLLDYQVIGTTTAVGQAHLAAAVAAVKEGDEDAAEALGRALLGAPDAALLEAGMTMASTYAESGLPSTLRVGLERAHRVLGVKLEKPFRRRDDDDDFS